MANAKILSLSHIKKQDAKTYKEKRQVSFQDGTTLNVDMEFRPSVQNELNTELLRLLQDVIEKRDTPDSGSIMSVALCLIIKHFTSIDVKGLETFNDHIEMHSILEDNGYLAPIAQSFDPDQLQKAMDNISLVISRWTDNMRKVINEIEQKPSLEESPSNANIEKLE